MVRYVNVADLSINLEVIIHQIEYQTTNLFTEISQITHSGSKSKLERETINK